MQLITNQIMRQKMQETDPDPEQETETEFEPDKELNNLLKIMVNTTDLSLEIFNYMLDELNIFDIIFNKIFLKLLEAENGLMFINGFEKLAETMEKIINDRKIIINKIKSILQNKFTLNFEYLNHFILLICKHILEKINRQLNKSDNNTFKDILQNFYDKYLSDYLNQHFNVHDKIDQLNQKFNNNIPRNDIPLTKIYDNYCRNRLSYTWADFMNTFEEFIMIDQLPPIITKDQIPIPYSRLNELMQIEKSQRNKFKLIPSDLLDYDIQLYYGPLYIPGLTIHNYKNFNDMDPYCIFEIVEKTNETIYMNSIQSPPQQLPPQQLPPQQSPPQQSPPQQLPPQSTYQEPQLPHSHLYSPPNSPTQQRQSTYQGPQQRQSTYQGPQQRQSTYQGPRQQQSTYQGPPQPLQPPQLRQSTYQGPPQVPGPRQSTYQCISSPSLRQQYQSYQPYQQQYQSYQSYQPYQQNYQQNYQQTCQAQVVQISIDKFNPATANPATANPPNPPNPPNLSSPVSSPVSIPPSPNVPVPCNSPASNIDVYDIPINHINPCTSCSENSHGENSNGENSRSNTILIDAINQI